MNSKWLAGLGIVTLTTAISLAVTPEAISSPHPLVGQEFDIAMNATTFFFEGPTNPNGAPANGTPFVVQGYIYPDGVFERQGQLSGVLPDGSPEFPELVLGTWICRGWHLQDGDAATGVVVATTQILDFDTPIAGADMIVTDGIELADFGIPFERAIIGATGRLADIDSAGVSCEQTYVGDALNATGGFNSEIVFRR